MKANHQTAKGQAIERGWDMEKDRRKFKRFDAYMSVRYHLPKSGLTRSSETVGLSRDISRDGIQLNANQTIPKGVHVEMEINVPDDPRPIKTSGQVAWVRSAKNDDGTNIGIRFTSIDPVDKFRVLDYAYNHWLETKVNDFSDPEEISEV